MEIKKTLKDCGFTFSKRFGQNFITDLNLLDAIVADSQIGNEDIAVEVGSGAGTLTASLAKSASKVLSFEIDEKLRPVLNTTLEGMDNIEIIFNDILQISYEELHGLIENKSYKVVANLPYYITTPVLFYFLDDPLCQSITVMVQKEVAKRLTALKNTPEYGAITAQINAIGKAKLTRVVSRQLFTPQPNVDSAVVRINLERSVKADDYSILKRVIAAAFEMRRKTLVNNLIKSFSLPRVNAEEILISCSIALNVRGEQLGTEEFVRISNALTAFFASKSKI